MKISIDYRPSIYPTMKDQKIDFIGNKSKDL